jgi:uncharacterized low-complexity protein
MLLAGAAFAAQPASQNLHLAAAPGEGQCGEGKCGAEGKCGEGKCGDASFSKTDTNNDGKVSRAELAAKAPQRAAKDFDKVDANHDGFISSAEAYKALKATYEANGKKMPVGKFSLFDELASSK